MFAPRENQFRQTVDDFLDSPFRDLGLLTQSTLTKGDFRFEYGPKTGLSPSMALAICLDFVARTTPDARTVTVGRLVSDQGSPGRLLKLSEQALSDLLVKATQLHPDIVSLSSPTGSTQLNINLTTVLAAETIILLCYGLKEKGIANASGIGVSSFGEVVVSGVNTSDASEAFSDSGKTVIATVIKAKKSKPKNASNGLRKKDSTKKILKKSKVSVK